MSRQPLDAYMTPPWMVKALLANVPEIGQGVPQPVRIYEPCVGDGAISNILAAAYPEAIITTNDIDPGRMASYHEDARTVWPIPNEAIEMPVDWVITNPPFDPETMLPILQLSLAKARLGVISLARISFLEPTQGRGQWLATHPPQRYLVTERHSFTGDGKSDSSTTAWLVWSRLVLSGPSVLSLYGWKGGR